ncbi:hypothetical protein J6590_004472 [Homalodisca vitripennis]|nr:hypothetical protein J6590_004472 [Homalodisca vitripennis]
MTKRPKFSQVFYLRVPVPNERGGRVPATHHQSLAKNILPQTRHSHSQPVTIVVTGTSRCGALTALWHLWHVPTHLDSMLVVLSFMCEVTGLTSSDLSADNNEWVKLGEHSGIHFEFCEKVVTSRSGHARVAVGSEAAEASNRAYRGEDLPHPSAVCAHLQAARAVEVVSVSPYLSCIL